MIPKRGYRFRKRSCSTNNVERDDDSKKSHPALAGSAASLDGHKCDAEIVHNENRMADRLKPSTRRPYLRVVSWGGKLGLVEELAWPRVRPVVNKQQW